MLFLLRFLLLQLIRGILRLLDLVTRLTTGYSVADGPARARRLSRKYEHSAHVVGVRWRAELSAFSLPTELEDFALVHDSYRHPEFILEDRHITLMLVNKTHAVFCWTDEVY